MLTTSRALPRRLLIATSALALAAASLTALSTPALAATTNVTVVGTSDVFDSSLIQSVIAPGFQKAYPQYRLNYVSEGTGKAITDAEAGAADGLIVHAPSLENSFVAGDPIAGGANIGKSYSLEKTGRAIFYGDYIFAGATGDQANVDPGYPKPAHNIVQAFQDVATAGAAGNANFVSRGGTPGTTVQEHLIWADTTGVDTCIVSSANGGGAVPSTTDIGQPCPTTVSYPTWYHVTGLTQGPNIVNANTCSYTTGANNCYVFTDRGTYDYLSEGSTTQTGNLKVVVRNNAASAPGGDTLLINTFHAYAINPAAVNVSLNTVGATDFLNYLTSPAAQTAVGKYLDDVDSPPFIPDAAPLVTKPKLPGTVTGGHSVTVTGSLANAVPGTPALNDVQVQLLARPTADANGTYLPVTAAKTGKLGKFTLKFSPKVNQTYKLFTPAITKVEYHLTPTFSDTLQSTLKSLGSVKVKGVVLDEKASTSEGKLKVTGRVDPVRTGKKATLTLFARPAGSSKAFAKHGVHHLTAGSHKFTATYSLPKGRWSFYVKYSNPGRITSGVSSTKNVKVN